MSTLEEIQEELKKIKLEREKLKMAEERLNRKEKMLYLGKKIINLNKFKPLFLNALKLDYEVGFNMFYNTDLINFEVTKGINKFVTIPYNVAIGIPPTEEFIKELERQDMDALIKRYNIQKEKISIKEYITRIEDLVGEDGIGFNVTYIPWEEPFEFIVNITAEYLDIFKQIKDRGLNIFDETDKDVILEIANKTEQGRILRKI